jgi:hypothetical protein
MLMLFEPEIRKMERLSRNAGQPRSRKPNREEITMTNHDELVLNLQTMIRRRISVEMCLILKEMLECGELNCRIEDGVCCWYSNGSTRMLDRIFAMDDLIESLMMQLLVEGRLQFVADDRGSGLNIRWFVSPGHAAPLQ